MHKSRDISTWAKANVEFYVEECGANGDCLFFCIAKALSRVLSNMKITMLDIRKTLAESVTKDNLLAFISSIIEDQDKKMLRGTFSFRRVANGLRTGRYTIEDALKVTQTVISKEGRRFQGTDTVLQWFVQHVPIFVNMNIRFLCFNDYGPAFIDCIKPPKTGKNDRENYIILYNTPNTHWRLVNFLSSEDMRLYCVVNGEVCKELLRCLSISSFSDQEGKEEGQVEKKNKQET